MERVVDEIPNQVIVRPCKYEHIERVASAIQALTGVEVISICKEGKHWCIAAKYDSSWNDADEIDAAINASKPSDER